MTHRRLHKKQLRRQCFAAVKALGEEKKQDLSCSVCDHIRKDEAFDQAKVVLSYISLRSEPDLSELMWQGRGAAKQWAVSVVEPDDTLTFRIVSDPENQLVEGEWGFLEPIPELCPEVAVEDVDMVLIPGVGFDPKNGGRLGRGKGHYDRFLEKLLGRDRKPLPELIGVCFGVQEISFEPEAHDVPMSRIVCERGFLL